MQVHFPILGIIKVRFLPFLIYSFDMHVMLLFVVTIALLYILIVVT